MRQSLMICCAVSNSCARADCVMSPVCSSRSGEPGAALIFALILSIASFSVPATSWFAALLKPMCESLICTKENDVRAASGPGLVVAAISFEVGTPPAIVHSSPVPAHAMQLRKLRRSIPSCEDSLAASASATTGASCVSFIEIPSADVNQREGFLFPEIVCDRELLFALFPPVLLPCHSDPE